MSDNGHPLYQSYFPLLRLLAAGPTLSAMSFFQFHASGHVDRAPTRITITNSQDSECQ